ncbi:hypothetical protein GCM10010350_72130 [Streptomyces galilaeus]|nr:hypothetical protein GCM10010350_72130 [Streptomyces galilaeus]
MLRVSAGDGGLFEDSVLAKLLDGDREAARLGVSREQPQPTGVEPTSHTLSLHSEVSRATIRIMLVSSEDAARSRLL